MQVKKSPKKDIRRWSLIFFQIGLILILFISWRAIEKRSYDQEKKEEEVETVQLDDLEPEDVEVTEQPKTDQPPPPPPPKVPDKLKIVEDDEDIEEDEPETVEDIEEPKVEVADIGDIEEGPADEGDDEIEEVAFQAIQDVPIFPGCEKYDDNEDRKKCMSEAVQKFVTKRFNTDIASDLGLSGVTRISVQFTVDENGEVTDIKARAPESALEEEAKNVTAQLPEMEPGKQRDKAVRVVYQLPIVFQVQ